MKIRCFNLCRYWLLASILLASFRMESSRATQKTIAEINTSFKASSLDSNPNCKNFEESEDHKPEVTVLENGVNDTKLDFFEQEALITELKDSYHDCFPESRSWMNHQWIRENINNGLVLIRKEGKLVASLSTWNMSPEQTQISPADYEKFPKINKSIPYVFFNSHYIHSVCVDKDHRGKGYGKTTMEASLAFLIEKRPSELEKNNYHNITLSVDASNGPARKLYSKLGFVEYHYDGEGSCWMKLVRDLPPHQRPTDKPCPAL